ncbi:tubulin-specific chaperone E-like [Homalodisca vitripennis]|nr:tubulin-specific chaperone E-like [Homalodisca vitripennis]
MISSNNISKWNDISELEKLPKLEELKFTNNPVQDNLSVETVYYKVVCRIGTLKVLNRKIVTREERRSAELEYLKECGREWLEVSNDEALKTKFVATHPRYPIIVKKYGAAEESELKKTNQSVASSLVRVTLQGPDKAVTMSLPKTMQIKNLLPLVAKMF